MESLSAPATVLLFLLAAVVAVPVFKKLNLGAILGYLAAGVLLGPSGIAVITEPDAILHFSEIGVVLLLFVIGLELAPDKLWTMRKHIVGLGLGQLALSASAIVAIGYFIAPEFNAALVIGLALGLSSTAFAIQLMAEKGVLARPVGRRAFAILLLQDLAVIPILFLVGALAQNNTADGVAGYWGIVALVALLLVGRFGVIPALALITRYGSRETLTAASLLIVVGAAYLMHHSGLSAGLGAFIAGMLLANSSFRHQLESDIEPFKGITLGLFFMAIGMTLDLQLFFQTPLLLLFFALLLMFVKTIIISALMRVADIEWRDGIKAGLMLSQGGEFAFVVMTLASANGVMPAELASKVNLVVGLSMALTSPLVTLVDKWIGAAPQSKADAEGPPTGLAPEVLILGFGRFGQTTGRVLAANRIAFTAIDKNAEHIEFVKKFGNKVYYGDATRLDVLEAAGIGQVKVVLVAIDEADQAEAVVKLIAHQFAEVKIVARARNRSAYWSLRALGAHTVIREMFKSSLEATTSTLTAVGYSSGEALRTVEAFEKHDSKMIESSCQHRDDIDKLIELGREGRADLERLFSEDVR